VAGWADGAGDATARQTGGAVATRLVEQAGTEVPDLSTLDADRVTVRELESSDR
jgi:electron transfer flavoprotein alpha/beta subunit